MGGFLHYDFGGLIFGSRDLYMEGHIFGILRYVYRGYIDFKGQFIGLPLVYYYQSEVHD